MITLAQEMERKGDEVTMQVSNGGFLTPSKPPPLVLGVGVGVCRIARVCGPMRREVKKEDRRDAWKRKMALETGLGGEKGGRRGPRWGGVGL